MVDLALNRKSAAQLPAEPGSAVTPAGG
jgi:hypothetical protein